MMVGGELKDSGQVGQEKCTGKIKIHAKFYLESLKKRHFGRPRPR